MAIIQRADRIRPRSAQRERAHSEPVRARRLSIDLLLNVVALTALYGAYTLVRSATQGTTTGAVANARRVLRAEQWLNLAVEDDLQRLIGFDWLLSLANHYYLLHFPITTAALLFAFVRFRSTLFVRFRTALILTTSAALFVHYVFPLAPPRMLAGYFDAGARIGPDPYALPGSDGANQFAAMPSMHVGWALLVSLVLYSAHSNRWIRQLALFHPLITVFTVVITAHHFLADVGAGALLAVLGWEVASRLQVAGCVSRIQREADDRALGLSGSAALVPSLLYVGRTTGSSQRRAAEAAAESTVRRRYLDHPR